MYNLFFQLLLVMKIDYYNNRKLNISYIIIYEMFVVMLFYFCNILFSYYRELMATK